MNRRDRTLASRAIGASLALIAALTGVAIAGKQAEATSRERTCFAAASWDRADGLRPCVTITRVYEDGSFRYRVSDGSGAPRYSGSIGAQDR